LSVALSILAGSGSFLSLRAVEPEDETMGPPRNSPMMMINHSEYDVYVDIQSDTGAIEGTHTEEYTAITVPVRMYATATEEPTGGLTIEAFKNTIYFCNDLLEFTGVEGGEWDDELITYGSGTCGHCENLDSIRIEGDGQLHTFPNGDWDVMYYLKFNIRCVADYQTVMDLDITAVNDGENWMDLYLAGVEEYDEWIEEENDPDGNEDGYVRGMSYGAKLYIDTTLIYLGDDYARLSVCIDSANYLFKLLEHNLRFDSEKYTLDSVTPNQFCTGTCYSDWSVDGDSIWVYMIDIDSTFGPDTTGWAMYDLHFTPNNPDDDDDISYVSFITGATQMVLPGACYAVNDSVSYTLDSGYIEIPRYQFDASLTVIDTGGNSITFAEEGDEIALKVDVLCNFPAGEPDTLDGIQFRIRHDTRLTYDSISHVHDSIDVYPSLPSGYVEVLQDETSGGKSGYIPPSSEYQEFCWVHFTVSGDDYDSCELLETVFEPYSRSEHRCMAWDISRQVICEPDSGNMNLTDDEVYFAPCMEVYAEDVQGSSGSAWQDIEINHSIDIDSIYVRANFDTTKFCLLGTSAIPGIDVTEYDTSVVFAGNNLGLTAEVGTWIGKISFGARIAPNVYGTTEIDDSSHFVADNQRWDPMCTDGSFDLEQSPPYKSACLKRLITKSVQNTNTIFPSEYTLYQNHPNPFNPSTTIRFDVPAFEWVRLEIFNILGQRVAALIDGPMDAGSHEVTWNAGSEVSSGVYFYRIQVGTFTDSKKMMLLR
jgi:hypothetical protein